MGEVAVSEWVGGMRQERGSNRWEREACGQQMPRVGWQECRAWASGGAGSSWLRCVGLHGAHMQLPAVCVCGEPCVIVQVAQPCSLPCVSHGAWWGAPQYGGTCGTPPGGTGLGCVSLMQ